MRNDASEAGAGAKRAPRVLHVLSQRPSRTGSGVTLDALVRHASDAGWEQRVIVGVPADDPHPEVGGLAPEWVRPLVFERGSLDFPLPGMSDVMPYSSSRFSALNPGQLRRYRDAWRRHLTAVATPFRPDVIHVHHIWIVASLLRDAVPSVPVVTHCHATGLRQMEICPHLAEEVQRGCARNERFVVLHEGHAEQLAARLGVTRDRIRVVGAGYRDDLFHSRSATPRDPAALIFVGKFAAAKGLPWLLDAFERVASRRPRATLHVAGGGEGDEARSLEARMRALAPRVVVHGMLDQPALADLMARCAVCVLPSFYEGVPLVLVEAYASGCRVVATDLPSVAAGLAAQLGPALERVPLPRLRHADVPEPADLPRFVDDLERALERALDAPSTVDPSDTRPAALAHFAWPAVFGRVEEVWRELLP